MTRLLAGAFVAALFAARGRVTGSLDVTGQWAAFAVGTLAAAAGWGFAVTLVAYFLAADTLTRWRAAEKRLRTAGITPRIETRDGVQVLVNGGIFVLCAMLAAQHANSRWVLAAIGALAAASADTWATEVGTVWGGRPSSILSGRPLATGMSGGVTFAGSLGGIGGALLVAVVGAWSCGLRDWATIAVFTAAGTIGMLADSLVGAALQTKRYCDRCREWTERRVHPCGYRTKHAAGFYWMTNDLVNFIATLSGAASSVLLARWLLPMLSA